MRLNSSKMKGARTSSINMIMIFERGQSAGLQKESASSGWRGSDGQKMKGKRRVSLLGIQEKIFVVKRQIKVSDLTVL
jgi:hypothetical protein